MEPNKASNRLHPLIAGAAVAVTLVSLIGVAAITGILPTSNSSNAPAASAYPPAPAISDASGTPDIRGDSESASKPPVVSAKPHHTQSSHAVATHRTQQSSGYSGDSTSVAQGPQICQSCGRVESVEAIQQPAKPSGLGVMAGAVLGGVLGHQLGGGNGRTVATVAGAVGGGYAGNEVEKRTRANTTYQVRVRMEDGSLRTFPYAEQPNWSAGTPVRVVNGSLTARG